MRFFFGIALAAAFLVLARPASAQLSDSRTSVVWKCDLAMEKMPSMIRDLERKIAAIPAGKRAQAAMAIRSGMHGADIFVDSFSWNCGWGEKGRTAAHSMKAQLEAIRARFHLEPAYMP